MTIWLQSTFSAKKLLPRWPVPASPVVLPPANLRPGALGLIDEVNETGREVNITKRGKPTAKLVAFRSSKKDPFFGRLKGV